MPLTNSFPSKIQKEKKKIRILSPFYKNKIQCTPGIVFKETHF